MRISFYSVLPRLARNELPAFLVMSMFSLLLNISVALCQRDCQGELINVTLS